VVSELSPLVTALVGTGAVAAAVMGVTALVARAQGRVAIVDVAWGLVLVLMALAAAVVATVGGSGTTWRAWVVAAMVGLWGLRLAWHIHRRSRGGGEDPRYEQLLGGPLVEVGMAVAVRKVFALQGVVAWFIALPVTLGVVMELAWWPAVAVGLLVWVVGVVFEAVGDAQLASYRRLPRDQRPPVLDTGLWRYTRHPNYFGDACVWWGIWLAAGLASGWVVGLVTVLGPIAMTYFLVFATGARLTERSMMQRPGYPEYAARTSMFLPLPPKR
jgi:steroid 5-alpha reductase family enzyme